MATIAELRTLLRAGASIADIRLARQDTAGAYAWVTLDRHNPALHGLPGWPVCDCPHCHAPATTTDEGAPWCEECVGYAVDENGDVACAAHDDRVVDQGQWVCGGTGTPTGWLSRYTIIKPKSSED